MQNIVEKYFQSIHAGNWQDYVADDIVFIRNNLENKLVGKEAYLKGAGTFFATTTNVEIKQLFIQDDKASVLAHYAIHSADGRESTCDVAEFLQFTDGKLSYSAIFFDTKALSEFMAGAK